MAAPLFTFADTCFGIACNSHNAQALAASCEIKYLQPAMVGEALVATATELWRRGRGCLYDITVTKAEDEPVALLRGYARISDKPVVAPVP